MSSNSGGSKPKKGFRNQLRNPFGQSSPQSSLPASPPPPISQESAPSEAPNEAHARRKELSEQSITLLADQRPVAVQSMSAPPTIRVESANPQPTPPAPITTGTSEVSNGAWVGLRTSLQGLGCASGVFSPLASACDVLLDCLGAVETAAKNQEDYQDLALELSTLSQSLTQYFKETTSSMVSKSVFSLAIGVERQAMEIKNKTSHGTERRLLTAGSDEEDLLRHYRRIQSLFRQLQNTRLALLNSEKQAAYDSSLSTAVNRRTCTEGTRAEVLSNLDNWVFDSSAPTVYWMSGMAGTGKTTIACTFSGWLERRKLLAASFFCTRTSADCRDVTRIVPTMAYQLARYSSPFQSALCEVLGEDPDVCSKNISTQFERLMIEPLRRKKDDIPDNLVVVIDAPDECDDQSGVEAILDVLFRYSPQLPLKFFVTSRPEPGIYTKMSLHTESRAAIYLHEIEKSLVSADIELYLKEELAFMSPRPSDADIEQLVQRSGALFIYASTLVCYIRPSGRLINPHKRLRSVLSMTPESVRGRAQIDALYTAVLKSALSEGQLEADETEDIRVVLRTVLLAQEPISVDTIAKLADIDDLGRVEYALLPLQSVLHLSETTGRVTTLHASFPDFMFNSGRSESYFCDVVAHSQSLTRRCFKIMEEQLRFNICDLESSFIPDEKVEDMQTRIKNKISRSLAYACRHWTSHLHLAPKSDDLPEMLEQFLSGRLLFWVEVLSLRRQLTTGIEGLVKIKQWLLKVGHVSTELVLLVEDACNFMTGFAAIPASQSTPHIYISSLPFCPRSSAVYKHYWNRMRGLLELKGSLMECRETAVLAIWNIGSPAASVAYSPDGSRVAVGCGDGTVRIQNAYDGTVLVGPLQGHTSSIQTVAFSPNGRLLASGSYDTTIRVWNVSNGTLFAGPFEGHSSWVNSVSFSPDGTRIVSGSSDKTIRIWNPNDGTLLMGPLQGHDGLVRSVTFSPDGALIASASSDKTIRLWNSQDGTPTASPFKGHTNRVRSIAFTPDGTRLVSGSDDCTIRVWNISDGLPSAGPFKGHTSYVSSEAVSPDGTRVASGSWDKTVRLWKIDDGTCIAGPFVGHTNSILSVAYAPDGTRVVSGSDDETIRVWNVREGAPLAAAPSSIAVSTIQFISFSP
ncbi:hypothetical protein FRC11_007614, partial [Ceratobasidium sp. 423]